MYSKRRKRLQKRLQNLNNQKISRKRIVFPALLLLYFTNGVNGQINCEGVDLCVYGQSFCIAGEAKCGNCDDYPQNCDAKSPLPRFWEGCKGFCIERKIQEMRVADCPSIPRLVDGQSTRKVKYNESITHTCKSGSKLAPQNVSRCGDFGVLTTPWPTCEAVTCHSLPQLENGYVEVSGYKYNDTAKFLCDRDHELNGQNVTKCQQDGNWDIEKFPVCQKVLTCSGIPSLLNGKSSVQVDDNDNTMIMFSCDAGFELHGPNKTTCLKHGSLDMKMFPSCHKVPICPSLQTLFHGKILRALSENSSQLARFVCDPGYHLQGQNQTVCKRYGTWDLEKFPSCEKDIVCDRLITPKDVNVLLRHQSVSADLHPGSTVNFICKSNSRLVGSSTGKCLSTGRWDVEEMPICKSNNDEDIRPWWYLAAVPSGISIVVYGLIFSLLLGCCFSYDKKKAGRFFPCFLKKYTSLDTNEQDDLTAAKVRKPELGTDLSDFGPKANPSAPPALENGTYVLEMKRETQRVPNVPLSTTVETYTKAEHIDFPPAERSPLIDQETGSMACVPNITLIPDANLPDFSVNGGQRIDNPNNQQNVPPLQNIPDNVENNSRPEDRNGENDTEGGYHWEQMNTGGGQNANGNQNHIIGADNINGTKIENVNIYITGTGSQERSETNEMNEQGRNQPQGRGNIVTEETEDAPEPYIPQPTSSPESGEETAAKEQTCEINIEQPDEVGVVGERFSEAANVDNDNRSLQTGEETLRASADVLSNHPCAEHC